MKRILAMTLALVMILLALPASAEQAAKGGFVEREIAMPAGYLHATPPAAMPDGGFAVAAMDEVGGWWLLRWASLDAEPAATKLETQLGDELRSLRAAPDGGLLAQLDPFSGMAADGEAASVAEPADAEAAETETRFIMNGNIKASLAWFDASGAQAARFEVDAMPLAVCALSGRRAAVSGYGSGITLYDAQGNQAANVPFGAPLSMAACGDNLLVQTSDKLIELDASGKELRSVPMALNDNAALCAAPDGTAYVLSSKGIDRMDPGAAAFVHMGDATGLQIGDPSAYISGACALKGHAIVALLNGGGISVSVTGGGNKAVMGYGAAAPQPLTAYLYDSELDLSSRTPFRVTALRDSSKLRKAASDFQRLHPELDVQLRAALEAGDTASPVEDAIRTINTDLLAGNGGDVLVLDGLPWRKYAQKGVLQDLSGLAEGLGLLPGILQGSRAEDGKVYAIPAQFQFTALWGGKAAIGALTDLASVQSAATEAGQTPMYGRTPEAWLRLFYPASAAAFLDEAGKPNLDAPAFARFLEALYPLYATQAEQPEAGWEAEQLMNGQALAAMKNGANALIPGLVTSTMDTALYYTVSGKAQGAAAMLPSVDGAGAAYDPKLLAGICAQSANPALAEAFVDLLFSKEIQTLEQGEGLPTVAAALDQVVAAAKELAANDSVRLAVSLEGGAAMELTQMDAGAWDALREQIGALNQAAPLDETLMGFIVEETAGFFAGSETAESAARATIQRAAAYLNE